MPQRSLALRGMRWQVKIENQPTPLCQARCSDWGCIAFFTQKGFLFAKVIKLGRTVQENREFLSLFSKRAQHFDFRDVGILKANHLSSRHRHHHYNHHRHQHPLCVEDTRCWANCFTAIVSFIPYKTPTPQVKCYSYFILICRDGN